MGLFAFLLLVSVTSVFAIRKGFLIPTAREPTISTLELGQEYPDISGSWANHQVQITQSGSSLTVTWTNGRPTASGAFSSASPPTLWVNFPDDRTYSGAVVSPDGSKITWSATNIWIKDVVTYPNINGYWNVPGATTAPVQIVQSGVGGQNLQVVWANGRPTATGSFTALTPPTLSVNFPDDRTYSGAILSADGLTITWSSTNIWKKVIVYPDLTGSWASHQVTIKQTGTSLALTWANGRPNASGSYTSANPPTISVNFPDDRTYSGAIVSADGKTITWGVNHFWYKDA
jgi:hypothetical protein